jgi:hypothetical protein
MADLQLPARPANCRDGLHQQVRQRPALIDREADQMLAHGRVAQAERLSRLAAEMREAVAP